MKIFNLRNLFLRSLFLFLSCSDPVPLPAQLPKGSITMNQVQYNGWKTLVAGEHYVFSPDGLGVKGIGKINVLTGRITEVCLKPNCMHMPPSDPKIDPDYCRASSYSQLLFTVGQELFYTYHIFDVDLDKVENGEADNTNVIYLLASYNVTTGENREILRIKSSEFEQMYRFIHHNGSIYYLRSVKMFAE